MANSVSDPHPDVRIWGRKSLNFLSENDQFSLVCQNILEPSISMLLLEQNTKTPGKKMVKPRSARYQQKSAPPTGRQTQSLRVNKFFQLYFLD